MGDMQLGPVGSLITVTPDYDYQFAETQVARADIRTRNGTLYSFIESGEFTKFSLPISWVSSFDRSLVNSWWKTGTDLRLVENSDSPSSFFNVRVVGNEEPFQTFVRPYFQQFYEGEIELETI